MYGLSQEESERILQLKLQKKDHMTPKFQQYFFYQQFQQKYPDRLSRLLILGPPLNSPESVQSSINLIKLPPVEEATIDEPNDEGQKGKIVKVCLLDESSLDDIDWWIYQNRICRSKLIWVHLQGERRLALKLFPHKIVWQDLE